MASRSSLLQRLRRCLRHWWLDDQVSRKLSPQALEQLTAAVVQAELRHSGQIRICIEGGLPASYLRRDATPKERAAMLFGKLRVWDTEHNDGVLIYLLLADRAVEIVADRGLARKVSHDSWAAIMASMQESLRAGHYKEALELAIQQVSALLEEHGGAPGRVVNELPDTPAIGPFRY